jgi:protein-S-isoprenylcysteine O-methyltransferase Ste14
VDHDSAPAYGLWSLALINSLVFMYLQLARREERDARAQFGETYVRYAANTPAFFPALGAGVHA